MMGSKGVQAAGELDPRVWSNLPGEVLEAVFARMPTNAICRLRVLSRAWKTATSTYSTFTRLCAETQPSLYALVWELYSDEPPWQNATYGARFFDASACKWMHPFRLGDQWKLDTDSDVEFETASDGGLVCFVNRAHDEEPYEIEFPRPVVVCNPLTGEWRELPLHDTLDYEYPRRFELRVDRKTGDYEVILVAYSGLSYFDIEERGCYGQVYSSRTNEWRALSMQDSPVTRVVFTHEFHESTYVCDINAGEFRPFDIRTDLVLVSEDSAEDVDRPGLWDNLKVMKSKLDCTSEFKANEWMRDGHGDLVEDSYPTLACQLRWDARP